MAVVRGGDGHARTEIGAWGAGNAMEECKVVHCTFGSLKMNIADSGPVWFVLCMGRLR